jgi:hypothetical protein
MMPRRLVCLARGHIWMRTRTGVDHPMLPPHMFRCARCGRGRRTLEGTQ